MPIATKPPSAQIGGYARKTATAAVYTGRTLLVLALVAAMAAGCAMTENEMDPLNFRGPEFLRFYFVWLAGCFALAGWLRWKLRQPANVRNSEEKELDPYDLAYLNEGKVLAVNAAITTLVEQRVLVTNSSERTLLVKGPLSETAHPLERAVYAAASLAGGKEIAGVREAVKRAASSSAYGGSCRPAGNIVQAGRSTSSGSKCAAGRSKAPSRLRNRKPRSSP